MSDLNNQNPQNPQTSQIQPNIQYRTYDAVKITDYDETYYTVLYVSSSNFQWITGEDIKSFLPINSLTKDIINSRLSKGHDVFIKKDWEMEANEVLPIHLTFDDRPNLQNYLRRAISFVNGFIQEPMANTNASVIYGFNVLNNKFIEQGFVFSEKNRSLKYIDIMDRADELEETQPEISDELMKDLEKYIEYRNILDRTYFIYNLKEELLDKLKELSQLRYQKPTDLFLSNIDKLNKIDHLEVNFSRGLVVNFLNDSNQKETLNLDFKREIPEEDLPLFLEFKDIYMKEFGDPYNPNIENDYEGFNKQYENYKEAVTILFSDDITKESIDQANSNIMSFYNILGRFLDKREEISRKYQMDQLVKDFTSKVNKLNMTL